MLNLEGYDRVGHYIGGLTEWTEKGNPLEGMPPATLQPGVVAGASGASMADRMVLFLADGSFGLLLTVWIGLVLVCGAAYWLLNFISPPSLLEHGQPIANSLHGLATAIYFSFVTATSVGFGDIVPVGPARALAVVESAAELLVFGCVVSKLVSRRQEILIDEIHQTTFEDRIGRVRTNLHVLHAELQALSESTRSARTDARIRSTASMFAAELRIVVELLYRPKRTPDEVVLEGLLSELALALRSLVETLPANSQTSAELSTVLGSIQRLADEICGECVPQKYAVDLKALMDEVRDLARRLR